MGTHQPKTNYNLRRNIPMKMKKVLAATLAATMVMASAVTVSAATTTVSGGSGSSETQAVQTFAEQNSKAAGAVIKVGGVEMKTSLEGVYAAKSVQGIAVKTAFADVKAALGLTGTQKPVVIIYDTDAKKSSAAMVSVNAAAEALGAKVVSSLNIDLGAKEKGKWVTLKDGSVAVAAGLPKDADTSLTYSVVCVQPGGETTILEDQDTNANTVTFEVKAGLGTYAIVAK